MNVVLISDTLILLYNMAPLCECYLILSHTIFFVSACKNYISLQRTTVILRGDNFQSKKNISTTHSLKLHVHNQCKTRNTMNKDSHYCLN